MSREQYVTPRRLGSLRSAMSPEHWSVLLDVQTMRVAATLDLQALSALRQPTSVRQFRNLLKQLSDAQVLARLERSVGGRRAGSSGYVYVVGTAGQRLLAAEVATPVRRAWTPRPSWLKHALAVSHLYVVLRQVEADGSVELERFETEPTCWRSLGSDRWLKPDAYAELRTADFVDTYFIEVDCGTEAPTTLAGKFARYGDAWRTGAATEDEVFPRTIWLAPTERRRDVIASVIERLPADEQQLHHATTYADGVVPLITEPP